MYDTQPHFTFIIYEQGHDSLLKAELQWGAKACPGLNINLCKTPVWQESYQCQAAGTLTAGLAEKLCVRAEAEVTNLWRLLQTKGTQKCEGKWFFMKKTMNIFITLQAIPSA